MRRASSTSPQAATRPSDARNNGIDGLRAMAMTMVIAHHCGLLPFGWTGVWLFFVISGYVITRGFLSEESSQGSFRAARGHRLLHFLGRRALRIVPLYLLYIAVNTLLLLHLSGTEQFGDLPWLLSFSYNWHMIFEFWPGSSRWSSFGHLWTLAVEQQFYLLYPLLALWVAPRARITLTVVLICAGPVVRWLWSQSLQSSSMADDPGRLAFAVYAATHCHLDAFLLGTLIARIEPRLYQSKLVAQWLWPIALSVAGVYAITYVTLNYQMGAIGIDILRNVGSGILWGQQREVFCYLVVNLVAAAALIHVLHGWRGTSLLASPQFAWVGRVSYGGYLFHALVLWGLSEWLGQAVKSLPMGWRLLAFAVAWLVTVALASASFRWFESPITRLWRARSRRPFLSSVGPSIEGAR